MAGHVALLQAPNSVHQAQQQQRFSFNGNKVILCNNTTINNNHSQNPSARWGHASVVVGANIYMVGGIGDPNARELCVFNLDNMSWRDIEAQGKTLGSRYGHTATLLPPYNAGATPSTVVLFGGRNSNKKYFNDLYTLDLRTTIWTHYSSDKTSPDARAGHTAVLMPPTPNTAPHRLVIFAGNYQNKYLNSLHLLDILTDGTVQKWHKPDMKGKVPQPRAGHTCTHMPSAPSKMVMFGGFDGKKCFNDVQIFCMETFTWTLLDVAGTSPTPRSGHTATLIANRYWLIQGGCSDGVFLTDTHILDLHTLHWLPAPLTLGVAQLPRFHHTASLVESHIIIYGGCSAGTLLNDVTSLDVSPLLAASIPKPMTQSAMKPGTTTIGLDKKLVLSEPQVSEIKPEQYTLLESYLGAAYASLHIEQQKVIDLDISLNKEKGSSAELKTELDVARNKIKQLETQNEKLEKRCKKAQKKFQRATLEIASATEQTKTLLSTEEASRLHEKITQLEKETEMYRQKCNNLMGEGLNQLSLSQIDDLGNVCKNTPTEHTATLWVGPLGGGFAHFDTKIRQTPAEYISGPNAKPGQQMNYQEINTKAAQAICTARTEKLQELTVEMSNLRLALHQCEDKLQKQESVSSMVQEQLAQLQAAHIQDQEKLKNLMGQSPLEDLDMKSLEELEEIHHAGLKKVGIAKQACLQKELLKLKQEKEELQELKKCVVCADNEINMVLTPCGHRCLCNGCSDLLKVCPLCRKPIVNKVRYYL